ncbi:hypothetical protein B0E41_00450 [Hydrogenophaga sp. A37]|uniref:caspase family protein n=1 Tax=Hydrogenophaga sp. A37 TaxID=1945864 RepID=UPI0009D591CC|nr:caspase family protein [Hydrogenophaga sp. A37]OOG89417.1 hypothetical protein B0E41_00450 [Hydrogenophaga sp. A37]
MVLALGYPVRRVLTTFVLAGLLSLTAGRAEAEARLALLIANESYDPKLGVLKQPKTDVALIETSLRKLGFQIEKIGDAGFVDIHRAISRHTARVRGAGDNALSFIYYAGHGVSHPQLKANYLIPTDVTEWDDSSVWERLIDLKADLIDKLRASSPAAFHFVVFDACRNELQITSKDRPIQIGGKAFVATPQASGVLVAYATQEGMTAPDSGNYAKALARNLEIPDVEAVTMFRNVQLEVQASNGQQPFVIWSGLQRIYFMSSATQATTPANPSNQLIYKSCRLPEFGQEGWLRTEEHTGSTGWVGGGNNQRWGCDRVAASFIAQRAIGQRNKVEHLSSSERSNKDLLGHVTYDYSCKVRVSWDPLYLERRDAKCGIEKQ